jgi:ProQ/FINO family
MGVDIYLKSIFDPWFEAFEARAEGQAIMRAHADDPIQGLDCIYDTYCSTGAYFRNGYNAGDVMWAMGLSWNDVGPMLDKGRQPTLTAEQIKAAMRVYVTNMAYLRACRAGATRIDLLGHEAGVVTAAEADNSAARLAGIKAWKKKRKDTAARAKAEALAAARAAEIEAAKPKPKGVNAARPTLHLKGMTSSSKSDRLRGEP